MGIGVHLLCLVHSPQGVPNPHAASQQQRGVISHKTQSAKYLVAFDRFLPLGCPQKTLLCVLHPLTRKLGRILQRAQNSHRNFEKL